VNWSIWHGDAGAWDGLLMEFPDYTVYQSYRWGEHRRHCGWAPHRLTATEAGKTIAMAQIMVRRFPLGVALAWVNGGPIGDIEASGEPFRIAVGRALGSRSLYCRVRPMREQNSQDVDRMKAMAWFKSEAQVHGERSLVYSPSEDEEIREGRASGNWRHNLRRASKYGHATSVWSQPDADEILAVYEAMQSQKNLPEQVSRAALSSLLGEFDGQCVIVRCNDPQGRLLALRGALLLGSKAWDMLAAATPAARKVYASHAVFWELMRQCASRGVQCYDMSGIDPVGNKGVYDFKKGTGAGEVSYLGEWDWATSSLLRRAANVLIKHRARGI
jgi:lipid II:glycine glycyltransferase (peptidoglycan interpeptide bridge formation enzyme)